jgi:putative transposase
MHRNTRFAELLKGLNRSSFGTIVDTYKADKHNKGFRCWDQLIAMLYAQVSGCAGYRELITGFNSQQSHHYHLGTQEIRRSTLSDANAKRNSAVFADLCGQMLQTAHRKARRELKELLFLVDSTPIPLKGLGYGSWTKDNHNHRTHGLKVHMTFAPALGVPVQADITPANVNDVEMDQEIPLATKATYVFDKGYCDYNWWFKIHEQGAHFVTRLKKNGGVERLETRPVDTQVEGIIRVCTKNNSDVMLL